MVKVILQILAYSLLLVLLLSFESVVGLPLVFLAVFALMSSLFVSFLWWLLALVLILSIVMAALYQAPMIATFLILIVVAVMNKRIRAETQSASREGVTMSVGRSISKRKIWLVTLSAILGSAALALSMRERVYNFAWLMASWRVLLVQVAGIATILWYLIKRK